jgi:lipopolysaccharide transport system permease protein
VYVRDLLRELVIRNVKIRYKGSILGIFWSLIFAVAQVRLFALLFRSGLGRDIPNFPAYVFVGILVWGWFSSSLNGCSNAITGNRELVDRPGFPVGVLPVVTIGTSLIDFLMALPVLIAFIIFGGSQLTTGLLLLPLIMILQFLFMQGLGYLLATAQVLFRDTTHLLSVILRLGFFLTPIFYNPERMLPPHYQWIYNLNPMVHVINAYRAVLLYDQLPALLPVLYVVGLTALLLPLGYRTFRHARYRFLEEL